VLHGPSAHGIATGGSPPNTGISATDGLRVPETSLNTVVLHVLRPVLHKTKRRPRLTTESQDAKAAPEPLRMWLCWICL